MMRTLTQEQVRVIGSLIEKEKTTPEYYPLTVNALMNACNQKTNREPVVQYNEQLVERTLSELIEIPYTCRVTGGDMRVPKYKQIFTVALNLTDRQLAVLGVLMLRGAQTIGEIKGRTGRIYEFENLGDVDAAMQELINREEPLAVKLPRQPGKDSRYAHLFCGMPEIKEEPAPSLTAGSHRLEDEIAQLREEFEELKKQFIEFKKGFE